MDKNYKKTYLKALETADLKDSYEIHWATVTMYAVPGDVRACPSCQGKMEYNDDGDFDIWFCDNCCREEYLCTHTYDNELAEHVPCTPYWFMDCYDSTEKTAGAKYWD